MASKALKVTALFLTFNLLFLSMLAPNPTSAQVATCPRNALTINACANVLGLVSIGVGAPPAPCCTLVQGLVDLQAAACLCAAIRANVLGINVNVNLLLSVLLNGCGCNLPSGFVCA